MTLPTPENSKSFLPLSYTTRSSIDLFRHTINNLIDGKDPRIAIVAGPCSIHDPASALEYAHRFKALAEKVKKHCFLVMRVYLEKPRTTTGWKGFIYDPELDGSGKIDQGILLSRKLLLDLAKMQVPVATEILDPFLLPYIEDLIAWGFIGARTSSSQIHRHLASSLVLPIGFKNTTDGSSESAIHAIEVARAPHQVLFIRDDGKVSYKQSEGNLNTHLVLRGGHNSTNYDPASLALICKKLKHSHIHSRVLVDCAHGNCQKQVFRQKEAFFSVLQQIEQGNKKILGMMLESHLEEGQQLLSEEPSSLRYGISITDPCIGWSMTEELVSSVAGGGLSSSSLASFSSYNA